MFNPEHAQLCALSGTPAYVFDTDVFRDRIARTSRLLGSRAKLCYAMKANPFLAGTAELDRYEVCSPGEFAICERIGIPMSRIVLSGVYKAETDLKRVIPAYGKLLTFTAESLRQFQQINAIAQANGLCVRLLLRLSSGNQFGIERNEIIDLIKNRSLFTGVDIIGLQHFSGTQRHSLGKYEKELRMLDELLDELQESGYEAQELEFGPGFYVEYFQNQQIEGKFHRSVSGKLVCLLIISKLTIPSFSGIFKRKSEEKARFFFKVGVVIRGRWSYINDSKMEMF